VLGNRIGEIISRKTISNIFFLLGEKLYSFVCVPLTALKEDLYPVMFSNSSTDQGTFNCEVSLNLFLVKKCLTVPIKVEISKKDSY